MVARINRFTGKPMPKGSYLGRPAGYVCDDCGTDVICDCIVCGAPCCCPRCCDEAMTEYERANTILVEMSNGIADVREAFVSIAGSDTPNAVGLKIQMKTLDAASEKIRAAARALERRLDVEKKPKT